MPNFLYSELTGTIISIYHQVYNRLGDYRLGYDEAHIVQALIVELRQHKLTVRTQVAIQRSYRGQRIGNGSVDLLINNVIPVEVKHVPRLTPKHHAQLRTYLHDGGWAVGLLLNFGGRNPEYRRLYAPENDLTVGR